MSTLDAHLELRMATSSRHPRFLPSGAGRERLRNHLNKIHEEGEVHSLVVGGALRAIFAWRTDPDSWFGSPASVIAIDHAPGVDVAPWLAPLLDDALPRMEDELDLFVDHAYRGLARALLARGLGLDSVQLLGDPVRARALLGAQRLPPELELRPLMPADAGAVVALHRETFRAQPEYCWFGGNERYLERMRHDLGAPDPGQWVLQRDGACVGHLGAVLDPDNPFFGPLAGMTLLLAPALRGRGLLRALYAHLLDQMIARGAHTFRGGTSQAPVMRLAVQMERPLQGWLLRRRAHFPLTHFGAFAP